jgi:hypothetical protein
MSYEKALTELRKATLASYLAKAPRAQRADDKISRDFEGDYYAAMKVANKHSPNMITPGFEKDPEKLAKAEKDMRTTGDLRDTFKRKANNHIKGIARAGRILAKEEVTEEAEQIDELKTSTLASLATKRFLKAHDALKAKDYGGYVKNMKKSQKAANALVPKSGWSYEDDPKNEETEISPQEKYRQIREQKVRNARKVK